ncbi:MAG TPA: hypothetical protein VME46_21630 [Acidimicrobiales bacterium]|nr:hypothetical protein [Acidimicrobiales bacterium]
MGREPSSEARVLPGTGSPAEPTERHPPLHLLLATVALALAVWVLRRPDQFLHPYVWSDEYHLINRYQHGGLLDAALGPLKGYFVWPTSSSISLAAWAGFSHLPTLEYWSATGWFLLTVLLVVVPRSFIPFGWRMAMVLALVLAPMNPEVFGVALYSFWWTSLWPLITFTWSRDYWWLRVPVLALGGMSSIAGAALAFPAALLFVIARRRRDLVATALLGATLAAQVGAYLTSARSQQTQLRPLAVGLQELRNFSFYELAWWRRPDTALLAVAGFVLLVAVVTVAVLGARRRWASARPQILAIVVSLLLVGVISAVPAPLLTEPRINGPRYYFLPFVALGWALVTIAASSRWAWARLGAAALLVVPLAALSLDFARYEPNVSWSAELAHCRGAVRPFYVPVQFTGELSQMWRSALVITPATCRRLGYPS